MSKIAIIGWGSLIWDLENLTPQVQGDWQMRAGPRLRMEFSRISPKRKMGLVVCLDDTHGEGCATHVINSARNDIRAAVDDLASRERAPLHRIGFTHASGESHSRMSEVISAVSDWCESSGWDGAVWTDLEPNFADHTGQAFSIEAGIGYLQTLSGENLEEAHRYIRSAPKDTDTPLRRALAAHAWWQVLGKDQES